MLQNIPKDKILEVVRQGPTFPAKVAKQLGGGGDTMLIGAILSTLISSGDVKVSHIKVGGSPLYYAPGQESKLEDFVNYLNDKDKNTFRLLKAEKVLQDSIQDPLTRVSLRGIKDFAKQFEIIFQGQKLLFWRFYSVSEDEAAPLAKKVLCSIKSVELETVAPEHHEPSGQKQDHAPSLIIDPKPLNPAPVILDSKPVVEQPVVVQPAMQQVLEGSASVSYSQKVPEKHLPSPKPKVHNVKTPKSQKVKEQKEFKGSEESKESKEPKEKSLREPKDSNEPKSIKNQKSEYDFFDLILTHVALKKLDVISKEKIKKTEYDLVLKNHDTNEYIYCKAKDKNTINEGDLAPALIFAQNKKMPCLFLSTGELSQRTQSMMMKEFGGMTFERMNIEVKHD
jgi:hypothetical protein